MSLREKDFTPGGMKLAGAYENDRNADYACLYKAILREAFGVRESIVGHHIVYMVQEHREGFEFQHVQEIPSADTLIFDHEIARRLWGEDFTLVLVQLACEPPETRDRLLCRLFNERNKRA